MDNASAGRDFPAPERRPDVADNSRRNVAAPKRSSVVALITSGLTLTFVALTLLASSVVRNADGYEDWPFQSSIFANGTPTRVEVPNPGGDSYLWTDGSLSGLDCTARSEVTGEPIPLTSAAESSHSREGGKRDWKPWLVLRTDQAGVEITCSSKSEPGRVWPEVFVDRTYGPPALDYLGSTWRAPAGWLVLGLALLGAGVIVRSIQARQLRHI